MGEHPRPLARLIRELARLPGIGPRTAERLAFHILSRPRSQSEPLLAALTEALGSLSTCQVCRGVSEGPRCSICADEARDPSLLCVVEDAREIHTIEKAAVFRGLYHVLGGVISPLEGVGPDDIAIEHLVERVGDGGIAEVILALDMDPEGESTARHIAGRLESSKARVSRIALGIPSGASIGYTDQATLAGAFSARRPV